MVKYYCDVCLKEIANRDEVGGFRITEKTISFFKHQKQDQLRVQEFLFCIDCAKKIRDYFISIQRSFKNVGEPK